MNTTLYEYAVMFKVMQKRLSVGGGEIPNLKACQPPSEMSLHFLHLWTIVKKNYVQIFERLCISSFIKQNVQKLYFKCPTGHSG